MSTATIDAPGAASAVDVDVSIASSGKDTLRQKEAAKPVDKREFGRICILYSYIFEFDNCHAPALLCFGGCLPLGIHYAIISPLN